MSSGILILSDSRFIDSGSNGSPSLFFASYSSYIFAISASDSSSKSKDKGCSNAVPGEAAMVYLSISPNTMSIDPTMAQTSASKCRLDMKSVACRKAKPVERILQR